MSKTLLASKVVVFEEEPQVRGIPSGPTAVTGAVGLTERGPFNTAVLCTSFDEYQTTFGGFTVSSNVALAAMGFFENGGSQLWVSRVLSSTATKATGELLIAGEGAKPASIEAWSPPYGFEDGGTLTVTTSEGEVTLTVHGTLGQIQTPSTEPWTLADLQTLEVVVDGTLQLVTLDTASFADITHATAAELADAISAQLTDSRAVVESGHIRIFSFSEGTGSRIEVTGGSAAAPLGLFGVSGNGTGNVANRFAVTIAELVALSTAAGGNAFFHITGTTKAKFTTVATGDDATLQFSGPGADAFGFSTAILHGTDGEQTRAVVDGTVVPPFFFGISPSDINVSYHDEFGVLQVANLHFVVTNATVKSADGFTEPYTFPDSQELTISVDGGSPQTIVISAGVYSATDIRSFTAGFVGVATYPDTGEENKVFIRSNLLGGAGSIDVIGGAAADTLGLTGQSAVGGGDVQDITAVTVAEVAAATPPGALYEVIDLGNAIRFQSTAFGANAYIKVDGINPNPRGCMGVDSLDHFGSGVPNGPVIELEAIALGSSGNQLSVRVNAPTDAVDGEFNLAVYNAGALVETFENLSRDSLAARFVETIVNDPATGSQYVHVTNVDGLTGLAPDLNQTIVLTGGDDGLADITDDDYIGDSSSKTGLHAFDTIQDLALLLVPGVATTGVHNAMVEYCEEYRDGSVLAVLDPPAAIGAVDMVSYVTDTAQLEGLSEYGAIYWPRVKVLNPSKAVFGTREQIIVPPSGIIAGVFARTDAAQPGGIYDAAAGTEAGQLFGVLGFDNDDTLKERKRDLVYPHRINPLTTQPDFPFYIDGSRTLRADGNFPFIAERRGVQFIERSLQKGLAFARHKRNTPELRAQVRRTIVAFLTTQMNNGAFRSNEPAKAFFVDVSDQLNPPSVVAAGKLIVRIGLATNKPAEFIILEISQDTRALSAELLDS